MMRRFALNVLFVAIFFVGYKHADATHIVGGQIQYKWITGNEYEVTLLFYRDCGLGSDPLPSSVKLCFFDPVTNQLGTSRIIYQDSIALLALGDQCYSPPDLCIEVGTYTDLITIPSNPNGYYIAFHTQYRNAGISNIAGGAMTYYAEMPDPSLHNSSPSFDNYPKGFWCSNLINKESLAATDIDGDTLRYYLEEPLKGPGLNGSVCSPKPYTKSDWRIGYSFPDSIIGAGSTLNLDNVSGILTAQPANMGLFVIAYRVEEWRNGVKIGEIRRDMQYASINNCTSDLEPEFVLKPDYNAYNIVAGDSLCFYLTMTDFNNADTIYLVTEYSEFSGNSSAPKLIITESPNDSATSPDTAGIKICILTECANIRPNPYHLAVEGSDTSCYGRNIINYDLDIFVVLPGIIDLFPNIFTPNGDGINDVFKVNAEPNYCFDNFNIWIYNRWGNRVFESNDFMFTWNGKKNNRGPMESDGVYYYIITSSFQDTKLEEKGFVHLIGNK